MAKDSTLDQVYEAIAQLRARGIGRPSVDLVARSAGIARSTIYLQGEDWVEVREVIKGKPSSRVKAVAVIAEMPSKSKATLEILQRVKTLEETLAQLRQTGDTIFRELVNQLQYYFALAEETPEKVNRRARLLKESASMRDELRRLRAHVIDLQAQNSHSVSDSFLTIKKTILIDNELELADFFAIFLDQLSDFVAEGAPGLISAVYIMCGLPASGKSQWIHQHKPAIAGTAIYIDCCAHTTSIRKFLLDRLRKMTAAPIHCVRCRAVKDVCLERTRRAARGAEYLKKERGLEMISELFEEVTFYEGFSSIILA